MNVSADSAETCTCCLDLISEMTVGFRTDTRWGIDLTFSSDGQGVTCLVVCCEVATRSFLPGSTLLWVLQARLEAVLL